MGARQASTKLIMKGYGYRKKTSIPIKSGNFFVKYTIPADRLGQKRIPNPATCIPGNGTSSNDSVEGYPKTRVFLTGVPRQICLRNPDLRKACGSDRSPPAGHRRLTLHAFVLLAPCSMKSDFGASYPMSADRVTCSCIPIRILHFEVLERSILARYWILVYYSIINRLIG
ncbi:unnamed protein product [Nesidiocoris tenuis]|uniref:Uncharacterized protein n=1 Tax=Nesidiocoris tenuis TaxID=355587 RepID=A0A6H5GTZ8_9HEMI|nr:unnamed protein product [Nesidiocoris tenuis]